MSEIVKNLENRILEIKADPDVGLLFVRRSARTILTAQDAVKKATDTWRALTEEANMMTPAIAKAAEEKGEAERHLTKKLIESEKIATEYGYSLEYVRNIQSSQFTGSEIRALETIHKAVEGIEKSRDLIKRNQFALPNVQYVGSLVSVAEQAVAILKQTRVRSDDEENGMYSDNDDDNNNNNNLDLDDDEDIGDTRNKSMSLARNSERAEIERMTALQLKAERQLRSTFDALVALEKDYQYAKAFLPIVTPRAERLVNIIGKNLEQAEAAVAIAEWRHERLRGVAPPKFLNSVEQATKRVKLVEKGIDELYAVSRDDEMRMHEKRNALSENFIKGSNFHNDAFETVRNERRALRGLMPSLYDREKRLIKRKERKTMGVVSEEIDVDDDFMVTGRNNEHLLSDSRNSSNNNSTTSDEEATSSIFEQEKMESDRLQQKLMEDANSAYKDLKQRINVEETKRKEVESKKNEMAKLEKDKVLYEKKEKERLIRKREISYEKARKNWRRFLRTMMDQLHSTIKRLRGAQRKILRIKRERDSMMKEDKEGGRRRAVENVAGDVVLKGLDAAWQKKGSSVNRENALKAALESVKKDEWLDVNNIMSQGTEKVFDSKMEEKKAAELDKVSLTLGVLDCTGLQAERLSIRQGNSHIFPEDFLAQMLNETLDRSKLDVVGKYKVGIDQIHLIPFRCNKGELPTRAQRKRFDGFILTSAISPTTGYFTPKSPSSKLPNSKKDYNALSTNKRIKWIAALRALLRDMIDKKDNLVALGNGHIFLASAFPESSKICECLEPKQLDVSSASLTTRTEKQGWDTGYLNSSFTEIGIKLFNAFSSTNGKVDEKTILIPYARDVCLKKIEETSSNFTPILTSAYVDCNNSSTSVKNKEGNDNFKIDGMICKTSNVLSLHAIPHVVPALLRERLVEIKNDIENLNTLKTNVNAPIIPSRMELQLPSHTSILSESILQFFLNIINGIDIHNIISDGNNKFGSRDILREDTNNMNEKYEEKMELVDEVFYYDKTGTIKNQSVVSVLSENLIQNAIADMVEDAPRVKKFYMNPIQQSFNEHTSMNKGQKAIQDDEGNTNNDKTSFSLKISSRVPQYLPTSPHSTFQHYTTMPKIIACGHSSKLDICSVIKQTILHNDNNNADVCDAVVIGIVPTKDNMLLVLPSHLLSKATNMFQSSEKLIGKYDKILQTRESTDENLAFSKSNIKEKDATIFDSWMNQIYDITDHPLDDVNRNELWSHDIPLLEYSNFKTKRPQKFKRIDGNIVNVAAEEDVPIYTLKEFFVMIKAALKEHGKIYDVNQGSNKSRNKNIDIWIVPILSDIYRNLNIPIEDLILKELTSDDDLILTENIGITIASHDPLLLKSMRKEQVDWQYVQIISNKMLLEDGGINKPDIDNLFNVQKYLRGISLYADGICVSKEMILEGSKANSTPIRPLIRIKDSNEAIQQMPTIVKCARFSGLSVFARTFLSDSSKLDLIYSGSNALEYKRFYALGVDGVISQNSTIASKARLKYGKEMDTTANEKSVKTARDTFSEHRYQREVNKMNINRIIDQTSPNSNKNKKKKNRTKMNPTAEAWNRREELRKENDMASSLNNVKKKKQSSITLVDYQSNNKSRYKAIQKGTKINNSNSRKTRQKQDQPRPPAQAAPKFRSMSSNFNRNKKVYKQGINRIRRRNETYNRRELLEKMKVPFESDEDNQRAVGRELWSQMR